MNATDRLLRTLCLLSLAALVVLLSACAAPTANDAAPAQTAAPAPASPPSANAGTAEEPPATPARPPVRTGGPLPPARVEAPGTAPVAIDVACRTDADCTVKNVGNCCGYYPACVNVDSPTDPQGVQAQCAKQGMASVCGFREIAGCSCRQGRCEADTGAAVK